MADMDIYTFLSLKAVKMKMVISVRDRNYSPIQSYKGLRTSCVEAIDTSQSFSLYKKHNLLPTTTPHNQCNQAIFKDAKCIEFLTQITYFNKQ